MLALFWRDKRGVSRTMIAFKVVFKGKWVTGLLSMHSGSSSLSTMFLLSAALHDGQSQRVKFKFVARQVVASVVIRAAKLEFVAESRTRVYFAQHVASTCNTVFCCETSWSQRGNTGNNVFQLALQQYCETRWRKMLPVLPDHKSYHRYLDGTLHTFSLQRVHVPLIQRSLHIKRQTFQWSYRVGFNRSFKTFKLSLSWYNHCH